MSKDRKRDASKNSQEVPAEDVTLIARGESRCDMVVAVLLLALGAWLSFNYFGHKPIPNSDFPAFVGVGKQILSGHAPGDYKRAPLHGMVISSISRFIPQGNHPDLTAGWLLNAAIYPFIGFFVYLIGKRFLGRLPAAMLAVIAAVNPDTLTMLRDPICEIHLLVWFLFAIYLMTIRSRWVYLVAGIATMVRYEAAGIIAVAFLVDVISTRDRKQWLKSLTCAIVASVPLAVWLTATYVHGFQSGNTYYLNELGAASGRTSPIQIFTKDLPVQLDLLWQVAYEPLMMPPAYVQSFVSRPTIADVQVIEGSFHLLQFAAIFTFLCGTVYAIVKRNWPVLAMVVFMFMYLLVHAIHSFAFTRFLTAVYWIALLVSCYGLQGIYRLINRNNRIPEPLIWFLQLALLAGLVLWTGRLMWFYKPVSDYSAASVPVLFVALTAALACAAAVVSICRSRALWPSAMMLIFAAAILFSNQLAIATTVRNGNEDNEFKQVDDWYLQNAKPGEKLACSMFMVLATIDEKHGGSFVPLSSTGEGKGDPQRSLEMSYKRGITYVVWDSRLGLRPQDRYYWMMGLHDLTQPPYDLSKPRSAGPYEYLTTLKSPFGRYVHIFKLAPRPTTAQPQ